MESKLLQIIQDEILGSPEPLTPDSDLFEAGLDSMAIMQLLLHIDGKISARPRKSPPSSLQNADSALAPSHFQRCLPARP
jgi:acyl carrier protein